MTSASIDFSNMSISRKFNKPKPGEVVHSDSDSAVDEKLDAEELEVKKDVKELKQFVTKLKVACNKLPQGVKQFYDQYDVDGSQAIEVEEFMEMLV